MESMKNQRENYMSRGKYSMSPGGHEGFLGLLSVL